jgi:hypothetical protein
LTSDWPMIGQTKPLETTKISWWEFFKMYERKQKEKELQWQQTDSFSTTISHDPKYVHTHPPPPPTCQDETFTAVLKTRKSRESRKVRVLLKSVFRWSLTAFNRS